MCEKHHYIPVFYLKRWIGEDGRLCVYGRPYDRVKANRKHPDATGYEPDLYAVRAQMPGPMPPRRRFFRPRTMTPPRPSGLSRAGQARSWMTACEATGRGS